MSKAWCVELHGKAVRSPGGCPWILVSGASGGRSWANRQGWAGEAQMSSAGVQSPCGVFARSVGARICPDPISLSIDGVMGVQDVRKLLPDLLATMPEILPFLPVK